MLVHPVSPDSGSLLDPLPMVVTLPAESTLDVHDLCRKRFAKSKKIISEKGKFLGS